MLFLHLLKVSLLLTILTLGYRWMVQFESYSKLNRALLWINVLASWTLPLIPLADWGPTRIQTEFHQSIPKIAKAAPVVKRQIAPYNPAPAVINSEQLRTLNLMEWLLIIYAAGVFVLSAHFLLQMSKLARILSKSQIKKNGKLYLAINKHTVSPYSFFRWIVINPEKHSQQALQHIIAHETEHVRHLHSVDLVVSEIQRIVLWFNPFAWFHQKLVQANLEYLADRAVIESGFEKKQYQYSLLKAVLQTDELPLTTSFAQSLLKNRIKMMNKKPSHYFAWAKYAVLIGLLYISSAFVAPYTMQIKKLIAPTLPKTFKTKGQTTLKSIEGDIVVEDKQSATMNEESGKTTAAETTAASEVELIAIAKSTTTKWVLKKGGALYWAISPLATLDDIMAIRSEIKAFGAELNIRAIEYDPLQNFIAKITVSVKTPNGSATAAEGDDKFVPMKGESGYIIRNSGMGTGGIPESLEKELAADYAKALAIAKANRVDYFEFGLMDKINALGSSSSHGFDAKVLSGPNAGSIFNKDGVGRSNDNSLKLGNEHKEAALYLDDQPATFTELNSLPFDNVLGVKIIRNVRGQKTIIIRTK